MNIFPKEIRINIFNYIEDELLSYWKSYFTKNIIIKINPKSYFLKHVVPVIDKGWKYITLYSGPCKTCFLRGFKSNDISCDKCPFLKPCLNCYWYNSDPYDTHGGCYCNGIKAWVSWDQIIEHYPSYKQKYSCYYDFIQSQEWLNYLEMQYQNRQ
jgi:hypothetical protein